MRIGLWIMAALYVVAGIAHFLFVPIYASIIPDFFPAHRALVLISGAAEIAGGIGVLVPQTRRAAAWGIIALLVAVSPANVHMALHPSQFPMVPAFLLWARVPLQLPLIWWAYVYTRPSAPKAVRDFGRSGADERT